MSNCDLAQQDNIMREAEQFCTRYKERLTRPRLEVLKIIAASTQPLGAYDVLKKLEKAIPSPKPPTAYRAIEFWQQKGFIHRIESLNAYVLCHAEHRHTGGQFMICDDCGVVIETPIGDLLEALKHSAAEKTFTPLRWNIEIQGLCGQCQSQ